VEQSRQIKFKKAKPEEADTLRPVAKKVRVLPGDVYENPAEEGVDKDAVPDFKMELDPPQPREMVPGKYYVIVAEPVELDVAANYWIILTENGLDVSIGVDSDNEEYYVYSDYFDSRSEARTELEKLKEKRVKSAIVFRYQ